MPQIDDKYTIGPFSAQSSHLSTIGFFFINWRTLEKSSTCMCIINNRSAVCAAAKHHCLSRVFLFLTMMVIQAYEFTVAFSVFSLLWITLSRAYLGEVYWTWYTRTTWNPWPVPWMHVSLSKFAFSSLFYSHCPAFVRSPCFLSCHRSYCRTRS